MSTKKHSRRKSPIAIRDAIDDVVIDISSSDDATRMSETVSEKSDGSRMSIPEEESPPKRNLRRSSTHKTPSRKVLESLPKAEDSDRSTRRSTRKKSPNKRYSMAAIAEVRRAKNVAESESDESEDELLQEITDKVKATALFEDKIDVHGQQMYGFKTPKKRDGMALMASNTPKTPKTPVQSINRTKIAKTPHQDRTKLKKTLSKLVQNNSGSDFSVSDSDFVPTSSSSSDSDSASEAEADVSSQDDEKPIPKNVQPTKINNVSRTRKGRQKADLQFVLQSDEYFTSHSSSKVVTSDHTLDRLKTPRLPHDRIFSLLRTMKTSVEHEKAIQELQEDYRSYFNKWLFLMNEGFNILLYGLGSKRNLIQNFHRLILSNQPVIVVNGFFPSLTIKDILDSITCDILDMTVTSGNHHEIVDIIAEEFQHIPDTHLFLIIHNLDGTMLRNSKAQNVISRLAKIENIHLLASIDHINTPLIWDSSKLSNYNFSWWDATTMLPYSDETAFENSLLVQNSGSLALSSMKNVFQSLTTNARGIYLVIVKNQIANKGNANYQGLPFKDLYWSCREAFLVSSDLALRAQLTEFLDHKLVKMKRTGDGTEQLQIPIEHGLLQQFVDQQEAAN